MLGLRITAGHPNLVRVLDYFDDAQDQRCIVMELVDGMSAAELRGPARRLPAPDEYRSIVALLTMGRVLDQGDAP